MNDATKILMLYAAWAGITFFIRVNHVISKEMFVERMIWGGVVAIVAILALSLRDWLSSRKKRKEQ